MRIEKRSIVVLMVVLAMGLLCSAQESRSKDRQATSRSAVSASRRRATTQAPGRGAFPESARKMNIFRLRYQDADGMSRIIRTLVPPNEATIALDGMSQSLIVSATEERLEQIERVISELDVQPITSPDALQMIYRIYMLELPSDHLGLKFFSMMATGSAQLPPGQVLTAGNGNDVQIENFRQTPPTTAEGQWRFYIAGRAASYEPINRLTNSIPDCEIMELEWEEDTPVMPTTRVPPLPESLQTHLRKLLGEEMGIVGYWFGNLSVPGNAQAPIGPWTFDMEIGTTTREGEVELEITVVHHSQNDPAQSWQVLSNSIRGKIDRPVIIGYNRDNRGVQTMGALVIVPERSAIE